MSSTLDRSERPDATTIRDYLEKLLASRRFRNRRNGPTRPARFLRFIVEQTLADGEGSLKEYRIGVDVLGRPDNFDPRMDSIVRVEGGRLRIKLREYYDSEGADDPIRIDVLSGSYVPTFSWRSQPDLMVANVVRTTDKPSSTSTFPSVPTRLLSVVWSYPLLGETEASWAVKESSALLGKIGSAREAPSLGVAIVTTDLALTAFGEVASSRVGRCIMWAVGRAQRKPPYMMLDEVENKRDSVLEDVVPDFRHTLAFGVILARAKKHYSYLQSHLTLVLSKQLADGSWPAESVKTISPVFTAIYALELLHLASYDMALPENLRTEIPRARASGMKWLMEMRGSNGLWASNSNVLGDYAWDGVVATAWVLHRLMPMADIPLDGWRFCLDNALSSMIHMSLAYRTWAGSTEEQRYRVEARVAAAVRRAQHIDLLSVESREVASLYTGAFQERAEDWVNRLPPERMDVGTAAFLVYGLVDQDQLPHLGRSVLSQEHPASVR